MSKVDRDPRIRARSAVLGIAAAVSTCFWFELGFSVARGTEQNLGYAALCGKLMLAAGLACAAVAALLPGNGVRAALALYVVAHGVADPQASAGEIGAALALGSASWFLLAPHRAAGIGALSQGTLVGAALCAALVLWPSAERALGVPQAFAWQGALLQTLVFALALASARAWESRRGRARPLPPAAAAATLALLVALAALAVERPRVPDRSAEPATATSPPDVFVLVLDTVRADHLSSYGYERDTTPNLARLLSEHPEAVQYEFAFSPASWTIPAHASLLSGRMPSAHPLHSGRPEDAGYPELDSLALAAGETLAEALRGAGYCTAAVVANPGLLHVAGMQRGFEAFFQPRPFREFFLLGKGLRRRFLPESFAGRIRHYPSAEAIGADLLRMHRECAPRPSFVLANYMEAHAPYQAPEPHAGIFAGEDQALVPLERATVSDSAERSALKRDRYDEGLHFLDAQLGRLFAELEAARVMQRCWLIVTADHGEAFHEHGTESHGSSIYNEQVRIPLIVKPPRGVRIPTTREPVSLLDVTTTIAGIAGRAGFGSGHDMRRPPIAGRPVGIEFRGGFQTSVEAVGATSNDFSRAVVRGHWKLLERRGRYELYDLAADPRELADRGSQHAQIVRSLVADLPVPSLRPTDPPERSPHAPALGPEEEEDLRALGYLH
jgi:arylsulfatase A-like enzyme